MRGLEGIAVLGSRRVERDGRVRTTASLERLFPRPPVGVEVLERGEKERAEASLVRTHAAQGLLSPER